LGGTSPVRHGDEEEAGSGGSMTSRGSDEVRWMAATFRGLLWHQRGKGRVRQGLVEEEKVAWVELTEGRKTVAVAATLQRPEVDNQHGGVNEKAVGWFPLEKRRATRKKAKGGMVATNTL
jgi:hypothetical protein